MGFIDGGGVGVPGVFSLDPWRTILSRFKKLKSF